MNNNPDTNEASCCPPGSIGPPQAPSDSRILAGQMIELLPPVASSMSLSPMPCYCTGAPLKTSRHIVLVFADVYGIDAGRHKVFADDVALGLNDTISDGPVSVLLPDLFRGVPILQPWIPNSNLATDFMGSLLGGPAMLYRLRQYTPDRVLSEVFDLILPYIERQIESNNDSEKDTLTIPVSCVGFCFGGWVVGRLMGHHHHQQQDTDSKRTIECILKSGVGIHPSFQPNLVHGESPTAMAERIHKPILLLPSWNDIDLKPNTKLVQIIQGNQRRQAQRQNDKDSKEQQKEEEAEEEEEVSIEFPTMRHGWVSRGDSSDHAVALEQARALQLTVDFIAKHH